MKRMLTSQELAELEALLPPGQVLWGESIGPDWTHDELSGVSGMPGAVVRAQDAAQVSAVMCFCNEREIPLTPRGAGTGLVGACVPVAGGVLLDMSGMNRILALDEDNLSVTVEPGVLLMELAAYVEERGFFYPPDPGEKSATIG